MDNGTIYNLITSLRFLIHQFNSIIQTCPAFHYKHFTLGIEEEYMVIDPETRELKSHEQKIVQEGQKVIKDKVKAEMHQAVVEVGTDICQDIDEAL